ATGHQDVEPCAHRRRQEGGRARRHAAELDQLVEPGRLEPELADVDRGEASTDALEHDVEAVPSGQQRIDEGPAEVDTTSARLQHALHELVDLPAGEHDVGQLVTAVPGDEDP